MLTLNQVSANTFFQVAGVVWDCLHPSTQQAIRQASSTGRTLHDSRITDLVVRLGHSKPDSIDVDRQYGGSEGQRSVEEAAQLTPPTPSELRSLLVAVVQRGARLDMLRLRCFMRHQRHLPLREREEQLLAVLAAVPSGSPVSALALSGGVPLSERLANVIDSTFPNLEALGLYPYWEENDVTAGDPNAEAASEYHYGAMQLLTLCGPRLRELRLTDGVQWPTVVFRVLRKCTGLTTLTLEAGRDQEGPYVVSFAHEDGIISSMAQLTHLRALDLTIHVDPEEFVLEAIAPYATSLARLSALAALTELRLDLSSCYDFGGDSLSMMQLEGEDNEAWTEVRQAHRTALLSALRAMPQLQHLQCPTLWLRPSEAAVLTALTDLRLGGLMPPPPGDSSPTSPLPPRLAYLHLMSPASPTALASLQIPSTLTALRLFQLRFGMSDVDQVTGQLLPEAVEAVGPAVRRLMALKPNGSLSGYWLNMENGGTEPLLPCAGVPEGHAEWLAQLGPLDAGMNLALRGFALQVEDVCCLAHTLGKVKRLSIRNCKFPVAALSGLLGLRALEQLDVDLALATGLTRSSLETALTVLFSQAPALQRVTCTKCPLLSTQEIQSAVLNRLHSKGKDGIQLTIEDAQ